MGIIIILMEYINQGDDPMWRPHGRFFFGLIATCLVLPQGALTNMEHFLPVEGIKSH